MASSVDASVDYNNNNQIPIKREPLAYTRARRAVQKKKKKNVCYVWLPVLMLVWTIPAMYGLQC